MGKDKKTKDELCWFFPSSDHGEDDGFSDSLLEYFQGDHEKFIAREIIQNAIDARKSKDAPVLVNFEKIIMPSDKMPDVEAFQIKLEKCLEFVKRQDKAEKFFKEGVVAIKKRDIPVLKISDFNTKGLSGDDDDIDGNWYRLVRATGTSSAKGVAGGSFGIGKGAPFAASSVRTVFYSSLNENQEPVFQGKARLVSHREGEDVKRGVGFYGLNGYKSIRDNDLVPNFFKRQEQGTDIFIIGYVTGLDWKEKLAKSVLQNFWLAIYGGDLEVSIKELGAQEIKICKDNLSEKFNEYGAFEDRAFFDSVVCPTQTFTKDLKYLGRVSLYVKKQDGYPREIMMVRKPKMLVWAKPYRILREDYSGVCICDDDKGNLLLRELEPPKHDEWDENRAENGQAALRELINFIKESLRGMGESVTGKPEDIPGVDKYLPESDEKDSAFDDSPVRTNISDKSAYEESAREIGSDKEGNTEVDLPVRRMAVVQKTGSGTENNGSGKPNKSNSGNGPGLGGGNGEEEGSGDRINTSDVVFRSICQENKGVLSYVVIVTARNNCKGSVRIVAVGDDANYPVAIKSAKDFDSMSDYEISGADIKNIELGEGQKKRIILNLDSNKKYSLGIEKYEY